MNMKKEKNILIYGIGSYKNRGVEAIVQSILNQVIIPSKIGVACYDIDYNKNKYNKQIYEYINHRIGYNQISEEERNKVDKLAAKKKYFEIENIYQKDLINKIDDYDICISAGGDNYCYNANDWLFNIDKNIKLHKKKLVLFGASLYEKIEDENLIRELDLFDLLLVRESLSYKEITKYIGTEKVKLVPDTAFSLPIKRTKLNEWYKNRKVIGLNVSPTILGKENQKEKLKDIIKFIDYILKNTKYSISLISHVTIDDSNDYQVLSEIYTKFKNNKRVYLEKNDYDCNQVKYIISKCTLMIAARTHASIAAYSTCIPTLVLGYSVKSKGIATDLFGTDKNYVISGKDINYDNLVEKFSWLEKNKKKIKEHLKNIMPEYKEKSTKAVNIMLEELEAQSKKEICNKMDCINCNLCKKECPIDAVETKKTALHFEYNERNTEKCKDCGKCLNICPINARISKDSFERKSYAAKNKDRNIQKNSTSGGIFTIIAQDILKKGGVVYGAERSGGKTKHIRISDEKKLHKIRGSKYSYSSIIEILKEIEEDIKSNKKILFSGTPCQVGAIKQLAKEYDNITYVSVICHGVLNDELVNEYLNEKDLELLSYRTKESGWETSKIKYDKYTKKFMEDDLMSLYINNALLRESCYRCNYTLDNNKADIILGDYWGIKSIAANMFDDNGVSIVIVNSKKGQKIFNNIKTKVTYEETPIENLEITHPNLINQPLKIKERFIIEDLLKNNSWELVSESVKQKNEILNMNKRMEDMNSYLDETTKELKGIKSSKRWRLIDKSFNLVKNIVRVFIWKKKY